MESQKKHILLEGLGALPSPEAVTSDVPKDVSVSPLAEPNPTLPLWRRVDKQYWWNEWMTKPFLDAGVCPHGINKPSIIAHRSYISAALLRPSCDARLLPNGQIQRPLGRYNRR
jgi:hypothetical protein